MTQPIDDTLAERGARYGSFEGHAHITQNIKEAMKSHEGWDDLDPDMVECLEMVAHKIGRIINGDPQYIDSWTDIIGYTRLVEKRLIDEQAKDNAPTGVTEIEGMDEFVAALLADLEEDTCDNPECKFCHPETAAKSDKPNHDEINSALAVLTKAGMIKGVD